MGVFGKNSRGGKRGPPSSSSSWVSTITLLLFLGFCVFGVYMLTSSSSSSLLSFQSSDDRRTSRFALKDSKPILDEAQAEDLVTEETRGVRGEDSSSGKEGETSTLSESGSREEESSESQQRAEEKKKAQIQEEETQHRGKDDGGSGGIESQAQIEHDTDGTVDDPEQQPEQSQGSASEEGDRQQKLSEAQETEQAQSSLQEESGSQSTEPLVDSQSDVEPREATTEEQNREQQQEESNGGNRQQEIEHSKHKEQQNEEDTEKNKLDNNKEDEGHTNNDEDSLSKPSNSVSFPDGIQVPSKSSNSDGPWETQEGHSQREKDRRKEGDEEEQQPGRSDNEPGNVGNLIGHEWVLCNVTAGPDYIPCLDNEKAIKKLHSFKHYEHRERHCPEESPTCLVPLPKGYRRSIEWPKSRDKVWYNNVPRTKLAEVKGHQNWVKVDGEYLTFPGGGTQFIHGALHYIDFIQQSLPGIAWGKRTRVILDVGCGVASFGGYLFERDVLAMSFAPKDEHEAQVQFALERGIPAISAVMGSQRLPFPSKVFDLVHCARCRVPWHADGGMLLLELNRVLRPGGYFVWSATPVYQKLKEDVEIWKAMTFLTKSMCWDLVTIKKDKLNGVAAAIYRKPTTNECYENRKHQSPPMCEEEDDPNAAWYIPMKSCMHRMPVDVTERGTKWPMAWPRRVATPPYWLNTSQTGLYGKPAHADFKADYDHWRHIVNKSYLNGLGINWSKVRNVMDMTAIYGGFAASLKDLKVWVMNVVNIDSPDTLPIIYERGLFGIYHDWCESFSTYPRTYDLLHADHLFSKLKERCSIVPVMVEVDRIVRPGGRLILRDESSVISEVENLLKTLHWEVQLTFSKDRKGILSAEKSDWRPQKYSASS
ncbi:putative methyltransferase PMT27 [Apostasia shenzhenica]|uniref:Putative methyltransferase PMT27 n=1 Tax=Apostasia shenzhenica TaxID=1088818 RepID=A0A2I0B1L6_9ASPA|nr:putative methyltransferase PMT27 [Apostasia shenzhenica]